MKFNTPNLATLARHASWIWLVALGTFVLTPCGAFGASFDDPSILVEYSADTLPLFPWEFISDGPTAERSQHTVFVQDGVLHMIDNAELLGNTLGYLQRLPLDPLKTIEVEFRVRVLSGESAFDERAPFEVWLENGVVRADLSVGPRSLTALGRQPLVFPQLLFNIPFDGVNWHTYRYTVDPFSIHWWVDGVLIGSAPIYKLPPDSTDAPFRRANMFITSAAANVELDYLIVRQAATGLEDLNSSVRLSEVSTQYDPTPIPGGLFNGGRFGIIATFENTSDRDICSLFFQVGELSGLLNELEGVWMILPTEEQIQGFGGAPVGSSSLVLRVGEKARFVFSLALSQASPFKFFVNVAGSPIVPGSLCPGPAS